MFQSYSGGLTEMHWSIWLIVLCNVGEEEVPDDYRGLMEATVHARDVGQQREGENGLPNSDEFVIPDGEQYSLCSKRLKAAWI